MKYQYTEYKPSEHLRNIIDCYWSFDADDSYLSLARRPVIPDACIDLIWSIDRPDCSSRLVGPMTAPFFSDAESLFGLRFRPFTPSFLIGIPLDEMLDQKISSDDISSSLLSELAGCRPLFRDSSVEEIIKEIESILLGSLKIFGKSELKTIRALEQIEGSAPDVNIQEISQSIGWSRQHLFRKCRELSGLSPKFLQQIFRLQRTIKRFDSRFDFSDLAASGGYSDQSHMIHDFRKLTSLCPSEYFSSEMLHLYNS